MTLRRLVLWRHGETDYNVAGRIQGQLDSLLTANGREQATRAARVLATFEPEVLLSSDLGRASATAEALTRVNRMPAQLDKRLRETYLGQWQGLSGAEVEHGWPGQMRQWRADASWAPPDGESRLDVAARAAEVVEELDRADTGTALLCTHGGLITGLTARLLEWPAQLWPGLAGVGNCHWVVLARGSGYDRNWRLATYNGGVVE